MKILSCDIGNSSIKFGQYSDGNLQDFYQISNNDFSYAILSKMNFEFAAISSVVPSLTEKLTELLSKQYEISPLIISKSSKFNLQIDYDSPHTLGIDRICGTEGAFFIYCRDNNIINLRENEIVLTIDCGTATTINVIHSPNTFSGGVIAPGLRTMMQSLNSDTAQLPEVDLNSYQKMIGNSTESCIVSGIINSTLGLIDRVISEIDKNNPKVTIFLTGGNSDIIAPYLERNFTSVKDLVLLGIYSLAKKHLENN